MNYYISIIIPCFNTGLFLQRLLNNLIIQGFEKFNNEIVIVDDGSTDNTSEIARSFVKQFPMNIKLIVKKNEGVSIARNVGLQNSNGNYIIFLDSDDLLSENTLEYYSQIINNVDVDLYTFGYETILNKKVCKKYQAKKGNKKQCKRKDFEKLFFTKKIPICICACIFKKEIIDKSEILFTPGRKVGEDVEFIIKYLFNSKSFYYDKRISFLYCLRENSAMSGYKTYTHSDTLECQSNIINQYGIPSNKKYYNYWLCYLYVSKVITYILKSNGDTSFVDYFEKNKKYLKLKRTREIKVDVVSFIISKFSINSLMNIYKKIK